MQPDTSRRIHPRRPLLALTSFRISAPIRSQQVREAARPNLNSPMAVALDDEDDPLNSVRPRGERQ